MRERCNMSGEMKKLFHELILLFVERKMQLLDSIQKAITSEDPQLLDDAAHAYKGAVNHFSAQSVRDIAFRLESKGKAKDMSGAHELFTKLVNLSDRAGGEFAGEGSEDRDRRRVVSQLEITRDGFNFNPVSSQLFLPDKAHGPAIFVISSPLTISSCHEAIPRLMVARMVFPSRKMRRLCMAWRRRSASCLDSASLLRAHITRNSSPPDPADHVVASSRTAENIGNFFEDADRRWHGHSCR